MAALAVGIATQPGPDSQSQRREVSPVEVASALGRIASHGAALATSSCAVDELERCVAVVCLAAAVPGGAPNPRLDLAIGTAMRAAEPLRSALGGAPDAATGYVAPVAGAAGAAVVLGLPEAEVSTAMGIASSMTVSLKVAQPPAVRDYLLGAICGNAVLAAVLAGRGIDAARAALEGPRGWLQVATGRVPAVEELPRWTASSGRRCGHEYPRDLAAIADEARRSDTESWIRLLRGADQ